MNQQKFENVLTVIFTAIFVILVGFAIVIVSPTIQSVNMKPTVKVVVQRIYDVRPSYEYLSSVTVYMVNPMGDIKDPEVQAGRATGTIVAIKNNEAYILTNHHVCQAEADNCYMSLTGKNLPKGLIKLTFVKSGDYDKNIDLELWKVDASLIGDKQVIKGIRANKIADKVFSVGHYLGKPFIYTEGVKAGEDNDGDIYNLPCVFGCSGSGIFNEDGEMVAVLYAGHIVPTTLPFIGSFDTAKAIAVNYDNIKEFLKGIIE